VRHVEHPQIAYRVVVEVKYVLASRATAGPQVMLLVLSAVPVHVLPDVPVVPGVASGGQAALRVRGSVSYETPVLGAFPDF
jgi:hypothetical protein